MGELTTSTPHTTTTPQPQLELSKLGELIIRAVESLHISGLSILAPTPPPSILEIKKREVVGKKFDAISEGDRQTLRVVAEFLCLHGKSDSVTMTRDQSLGDSGTVILEAIDRGVECGLFKWEFEIHSRHLLIVNPALQDALATYLWGE
jgi:hypothetical protein